MKGCYEVLSYFFGILQSEEIVDVLKGNFLKVEVFILIYGLETYIYPASNYSVQLRLKCVFVSPYIIFCLLQSLLPDYFDIYIINIVF